MKLSRFSPLGFLSACYVDASAQDPQVLDLKNPFTLPSQLVRRVVSANQSWRGYLHAIWTGHGSYREYGGASYTGQIRCLPFPVKHGQGTYIMPNGILYQGELKEDVADGYGVVTLPDQTRYECMWKKSAPQGQVVVIFPDGSRETGKWKKGAPPDHKTGHSSD